MIVPGYGAGGESFDRGRVCGPLSEIDLVDAYLPAVVEEFESEGIRYTVLNTRDRPGIAPELRHKHVSRYSLVLHLRAGWFPKPPVKGKNVTQVYYTQANSFGLADEMSDAVGQWGACWSFGHKTANPKQVKDEPLLACEETKAIAVEPFCINGPDTQEFLKRAQQLGHIVARVVADHLRQRDQACIARAGGKHAI